jgi:hypothetical protein
MIFNKPTGRFLYLIAYGSFLVIPQSCAPFDKIYSHEFDSGFFTLKTPEIKAERIYLDLKGDSVVVYPIAREDKIILPDGSVSNGIKISSVRPGTFLYNSTFVKSSIDIDLSTVLVKFRQAREDVASQLNANVNGVLYAGLRKDFFKLKTNISRINELHSFVRHTGFDFGFFAGFGITPVNPTVTISRTIQEYDGIVFQKGISVFGTFENLSVGLALGFDNLLSPDRRIWIYNQKPWIGLVLGIANF